MARPIVPTTMMKTSLYALRVFYQKKITSIKIIFLKLILKTLAKRTPKDTIRRLLAAQYKTYGSKFIEYLFGSKALLLLNSLPQFKAIDLIAISLSGK